VVIEWAKSLGLQSSPDLIAVGLVADGRTHRLQAGGGSVHVNSYVAIVRAKAGVAARFGVLDRSTFEICLWLDATLCVCHPRLVNG
jgi:hypothetical protein